MLRVIGVVDVVWRLMIASKEYGFAMALDPVTKIDNRVVQQEWSNSGRANLYSFTRDQCFIFNPGFDFCLPDGKVAVLQLDRHNLFNSLARHRVEGPVQSQTVSRYEVRDKKRQALNVIPVRVGDQYMGCYWKLGQQRLGERKDTGSSIQNQQFVGIGPNFDTGGIAAIANRGGPR